MKVMDVVTPAALQTDEPALNATTMSRTDSSACSFDCTDSPRPVPVARELRFSALVKATGKSPLT